MMMESNTHHQKFIEYNEVCLYSCMLFHSFLILYSQSNIPVKWAQVKTTLYLTLEVLEAKEEALEIQLSETQLTVEGSSEGKDFKTVIEFYGEVKPAVC